MSTKKTTFIENVPILSLVLAVVHLIVRFLLIHRWQYDEMFKNENNTHFAISLVVEVLSILQILSIFIDLVFQTYSTFKYSIVLQITKLSAMIFLAVYLICFSGELFFAWAGETNTCKQLGIGVFESEEKGPVSCAGSIETAIILQLLDIAIIFLFVPLNFLLLKFSWDFSSVHRQKVEFDDNEDNS